MSDSKMETPGEAAETLLGCFDKILTTFETLSPACKEACVAAAYGRAELAEAGGYDNDVAFYAALAGYLSLLTKRQPGLRRLQEGGDPPV